MFSYLHQPKGFYKRLFLLALPVIVQNFITTSPRLFGYLHGRASRQRPDVRRHGSKCAGLYHSAHRFRPAKRLKRTHQPVLGRGDREYQPCHGHRLFSSQAV